MMITVNKGLIATILALEVCSRLGDTITECRGRPSAAAR